MKNKAYNAAYTRYLILLIRNVGSTHSRVHITKQTLDFLGDKFEVEQGEGGGRDAYLADHKIETYLIVPPKVSQLGLPNRNTRH